MTAENPWLAVSLADYEGHMALPHVAQTQLLSEVFARLLDRLAPRSIAIAGCAGGNGFERIDPAAVDRVVGIDINRDFLEAARKRHANRFASLELLCADIEADAIDVEPVDLVYAALILEYTDPAKAFPRLWNLTRPGGVLAIVSQLANDSIPEITPSPYTRLAVLGPQFRFVDTNALRTIATASGWEERESTIVRSAGGKSFRVQLFASSGG